MNPLPLHDIEQSGYYQIRSNFLKWAVACVLRIKCPYMHDKWPGAGGNRGYVQCERHRFHKGPHKMRGAAL